MFTLKYMALALILATAGGAFAEDVIAPEITAQGMVEKAIERGAFGALDVKVAETSVLLSVNGEAVTRPGSALLVEPEDRVGLVAGIQRIKPADAPGVQRTFDDVGLFRETNYEEITWEAEADDVLISSGDAAVTWKPGGTDGRASYVTASIARLEVDRGARLAANPETAAPAILWSGKSGVLLIPGVAFDRNGDGMLQGQNIGIYPNEAGDSAPNSVKERAELYHPPATFYRLDERTRDAVLTVGITLGELAPPQFEDEKTEEKRFVAVSPRLLTFLRAFEAKLASKNLPADKLVILRGFVSPTDRRRLERLGVDLAEFTRFQYGDAVALVLDPKGDPKVTERQPIMGDLDGDGQTTIADAEVLAGCAKEVMDELGMFGGLGISGSYEGPGPSKGTPYVHVDLRGWYSPFREE